MAHAPQPVTAITPARQHVTPPHQVGSPAARRAATVAARTQAAGQPPAAAVYQPWTSLLKHAESRFKAEMTAALAALERDTAAAGQLLDVAHVTASEAAGQLERAAWAAWNKYMQAADATRNSILETATMAYDDQVRAAHDRYSAALDSAEATYKSIAADAGRARSDVGIIAS